MDEEPRFSTPRWGWALAAVIALKYVVALPTAMVHGIVRSRCAT